MGNVSIRLTINAAKADRRSCGADVGHCPRRLLLVKRALLIWNSRWKRTSGARLMAARSTEARRPMKNKLTRFIACAVVSNPLAPRALAAAGETQPRSQ